MPNKKWTKKDEKYLNEKIKKASPQWENIDVDKFIAEDRGYNHPNKKQDERIVTCWDENQLKKSKKKKQHYIYVARLKIPVCDCSKNKQINYIVSDYLIDKNSFGFIKTDDDREFEFCPYGIKLKKGEQVRIPILVDKAEVVK